MYENYLVHHGIKGMRWGIRRFQNKDGTLTEAGKRRIQASSDKNKPRIVNGKFSAEDAARGTAALRGEAATDFRNMASIAREGVNITREARTLSKQHSENVKQRKIAKISKMDLSDMSDDELRQAINRMNLERSYKSYSVETVQNGRDHVDSLLQTAGGLLAIGVGAAGIFAAIEELKK